MPKLSKEELIAKLASLGVPFDVTASYNDLLKVLKEQGETPALKQADGIADGIADVKADVKEIAVVSSEEDGKTAEEKAVIKEVTNPFSSFETKQPLTGKAQLMRKILMSQPRVPAYIPLGHEEKIGSTHQVTLNGYTMFIRKGQQVDVPYQVKEVLDEKFAHQMNVRQHPLRVSNVADVKLQAFD